jgi:oxepin-CoA hydrolase/3-oxo-5,6-dehydrosuberyl-CoA semialdehyde dehydrogenase
MQKLENYVLGSWRAGSGKLAPLHDPTTGAQIAEAGTGGIDMKSVLDHARTVGGPRLSEMTFAERGAMLAAASKIINSARDELIEIAVRNGGNTRKDAKFDIDGAWGTLFAYAEFAKKLGSTRVMLDGDADQLGRTPRFVSQHVLVPRQGVAVHVNAFNFPGWGFAEKAACAWLAGVPVVTKPATATSLLAERIVRLLVEAKALPDGALQLLCGSTGDLLDHLGPQDVLAFTGSADTGYLLRSKENLLRWSVRVNIEADSLNSATLGPDVSPGSDTWALFVKDVVRDMTQKAGQKCTAIRRILVPHAAADAVVGELSSRLAAVKVGDPANDEVGMGPLSTASQKTDVLAGIAKLRTESDVLFGSTDEPALVGAAPGKGWFVGPMLLKSKDAKSAKVVHEHEVFGPCATVLPYDGTVAEAAGLVAKGMGGLVASVFSDDRDFVGSMVAGIGAWHGRLYLGSAKMADQSIVGPGGVLPASVHGGPGRAGGGEELGLHRGMAMYQQRVALQGDRAVLEKLYPKPA